GAALPERERADRRLAAVRGGSAGPGAAGGGSRAVVGLGAAGTPPPPPWGRGCPWGALWVRPWPPPFPSRSGCPPPPRRHRPRGDADDKARAEAEARQELERNLYFTHIALAEREQSVANWGRAEELLDDCPAHLRDWEWHYLKRLRHTPPLTIATGQRQIGGT